MTANYSSAYWAVPEMNNFKKVVLFLEARPETQDLLLAHSAGFGVYLGHSRTVAIWAHKEHLFQTPQEYLQARKVDLLILLPSDWHKLQQSDGEVVVENLQNFLRLCSSKVESVDDAKLYYLKKQCEYKQEVQK